MPVTTFSGTVEDGQVKLAANVHLPKFDLAELVSRMPADYQATEEGFGEPVGKEEW